MNKSLATILLLVIVVFAVVLVGCDSPSHVHELEHVEATASTCNEFGTQEYWRCTSCNKLFSDAKGTTEITVPKSDTTLGHTLTHHNKVDATCTDAGIKEYWSCSVCEKNFADENCTIELADLTINALGHNYGTITYTWAKDYSTCTATRACACGDTQTATATVQSRVTQEATADSAEITTHTATFSEEWAVNQNEAVVTGGCLDPSQPDIGGW